MSLSTKLNIYKGNKSRYGLMLWLVLLFPYSLLIPAGLYYFHRLKSIKGSSFIIVNKAEMKLYHYNYFGDLLQTSSIASGKKFGNKKSLGDFKTPEGVFQISDIEDASSWSHDFSDDSVGKIIGAYGPYFLRLNVPGQKGIGIHGTHDDASIGTRVTEGCIRLSNKDLKMLIQTINIGSVVVITPGIEDVKDNGSGFPPFREPHNK
jgi:hypothetical protein